MRDNDKLSIRDIERATENGNEFFAKLAKELLDTMRENDRLREMLELALEGNECSPWFEKAYDVIQRNKDSDV